MSDLYEISQNTKALKTCPVIIQNDEDSPEYNICGAVLQPMVTTTIIGDDYGSWPEIGVYFDCGHTFAQMATSLKYAEYI